MGNISRKGDNYKPYFNGPAKVPDGFQPYLFSDSSFGNFSTPETIDELNKEENYGILPENVFSPLFWRTYYRHYFRKNNDFVDDSVEIDDDDSTLEVNWKKQFFKRYHFRSEYYYTKKKYLRIPNRFSSERGKFFNQFSLLDFDITTFYIFLIGKKGIGKRKYLDSLVEGSNEITECSMVFGNVKKRNLMRASLIVIDTKDLKSRTYEYNSRCGIFLCFSLTDRKSFEDVKKIVNHKKIKKSINENTVAPILLGMCIVKKEEDENQEEENKKKENEQKSEKKERKIPHEEIQGYIEKSNKTKWKNGKIHGYIEILIQETPKKSVFEVRNLYLSLGVMLDSLQLVRSTGFDLLLREEMSHGPYIEQREFFLGLIEDLEDVDEIHKRELRSEIGFTQEDYELFFRHNLQDNKNE